MLNNTVKYTIGLPFLLLITFGVLIEVVVHLFQRYTPNKNELAKEYLIKLWRPIK